MILEFLKELKYSYHLNAKIYTEGSCFRLYKMLKAIYPQAIPLYSEKDLHWITEIDGKYYDINGELSQDYLEFKEYVPINDQLVLESAYVSTYEGQSSQNKKYNRAI